MNNMQTSNVNSPLISVIVPVYNVAEYLPQCLDSIINQTYQNLQIILVNDGSKDNSLEICQDYASRDPRIQVLDKPNGGLSSARNKGLEYAQGEYISFVDSDDWIELNTYEDSVAILQTYPNTDILDFTIDIHKNGIIRKTAGSSYVLDLSPSEALIRFVNYKDIHHSSCNKLYRRGVISNIRFQDGRTDEDMVFNLYVLTKIRRLIKIDQPFYNYRVGREGAITTGFKPDRVMDMYLNMDEVLDKVAKETPQYLAVCNTLMLRKLMDPDYKGYRNPEVRKALLPRLIPLLPKFRSRPYFTKHLPTLLKRILFLYAPKLYVRLLTR